MSIQANNCSIQSLFTTANYQFKIPDYQRPYSWTTNEVSNLLDDITNAFPYGETHTLDSGYFLGSIVIIKKSTEPQADVVDGQQRITTLALIFSVICHLMSDFDLVRSENLRQNYIEKKDIIDDEITTGLKLRSLDDDFFGKFFRSADGMDNLLEISLQDKLDSQQRLIENARYLVENKLHKPNNVELCEWLTHLLRNITKNCYLVAISTEDFDTAYRIFSTINSRGLNLRPNDVLKAEILGKVTSEERSKYTEIWDIEESDLGREDFEKLFYIMRGFLLNQKKPGELLTTYRKEILQKYDSAKFIDEVLKPSSDTFEHIRKGSYCCDDIQHQTSIRNLCLWLNKIDNSDWIPTAIYFIITYPHDSQAVLDFLTQLERLVAGLMILRVTRNSRAIFYHDLIGSIKEGKEVAINKAHKLLKSDERKKIVKKLNGDIYQDKQIRSYVLLRLDSALADGGKSPSFEKMPTIEHILPQNPKEQWLDEWGDMALVKKWVHRLGNLAFLSAKKNLQASNYDFATKKEKYFAKSCAPVFPITARVLIQNKWTPEIVEKYQDKYVSTLKKIWDL